MCCAAAAAEGCLLLLTDLRLLCATLEGGRLLWHVPLREARAFPLSAIQPVSPTPHPTQRSTRPSCTLTRSLVSALRRHCSHREQPRACVPHAPRREPHRCG